MVTESQYFRRLIKTGAADEYLDRPQHGQPVFLEGAGDLERQVRLDQDRQLFDNLSRLGLADGNLAAEASGFDQLDSGLPTWRVRQLDEDCNLRLEPSGGWKLLGSFGISSLGKASAEFTAPSSAVAVADRSQPFGVVRSLASAAASRGACCATS